MTRWSAWTLALMLALLGCSKPVTKERYCEEYAKRFCALSAACCAGGREVERCEAGAVEECRSIEAELSEAQFDLDAARACIDELDAAEGNCDRKLTGQPGSPCERVFLLESQEPAAAGESCLDRACAVGLACDSNGNVCRASLAEGASCAGQPNGCAPEMRCNPDTVTCEPKKEGGESCLSSGECVSFLCTPSGTCEAATHPFCLIEF